MEGHTKPPEDLIKRNWTGIGFALLVWSPFAIIISTMVTWPAILDALEGRLIDWETPVSLTVIFVGFPLFGIFSFLARTRIKLDSAGLEKRGLLSTKTIEWSERPYVGLDSDGLVVRGPTERIVLPTHLFRYSEELEDYLRSQAEDAAPNPLVARDPNPRERGSGPVNSDR